MKKKSPKSQPDSPQDFVSKAKAYWTPEQTAKVTGGKRYPIMPGEAPELLRVMSLLNSDGSMSADSVRKFQQANHMLNLLLTQLDDLCARHKTVYVLDACCGSSFIALVVAWYIIEQKKHPCRVIGIDRNEAVIEKSNERAKTLGWDASVRFMAGDIDKNAWEKALKELFPTEEYSRPHLLCALHACDTATDHALALGIAAQADQMAVAPCCQAELAKQWSQLPKDDHPLQAIFQSPNLRRDTAATFTDALRLLLIRSKGYEVTATEFVPSTHTPKNRLLMCTRRGKFHRESEHQYAAMKAALAGTTITLESLLA